MLRERNTYANKLVEEAEVMLPDEESDSDEDSDNSDSETEEMQEAPVTVRRSNDNRRRAGMKDELDPMDPAAYSDTPRYCSSYSVSVIIV